MSHTEEENASEEEYEGSDNEFKHKSLKAKHMRLRPRVSKKLAQYTQYDDPASDTNEEILPNPSAVSRRSGRARVNYISQQNKIDEELDRLDAEYEKQLREQSKLDEQEDEEEFGVFNPPIDQILWRRLKKDAKNSMDYEYYVKLKEYSYLHCVWIPEEELVSTGKFGKAKLNRFIKQFDQRIEDREIDPEREDSEYFDPSYIRVDKVLYAAEIFPVIHSKKANEIKGKWPEFLSVILSKLLNFSKDQVHYGVFFMDPVNPEKDNCPDYRKVVLHPMDLGTISNRIYLGYYKNFQDIWKDLGLVFKNCRAYNPFETCDVRVLGDTLRELARILYKKWYPFQMERYNSLLEENTRQREDFIRDSPQEREQFEKKVKEDISRDLQQLSDLLDQGVELIERAEVERVDRDLLKDIKVKLIDRMNILLSLLKDDDPMIIGSLYRELERVFNFSHQITGSDGPKAEGRRIFATLKQVIDRQLANYIEKKFEEELVTKLNLPTPDEIQKFHPGEFSYNWLKDSEAGDLESEEFKYFEEEEMEAVNLTADIDKVYLVKWTNLSYLDTSWELESVIDSPSHINDFKTFNRSQDKDTRTNFMNQLHRHRNLVELMINPKKKTKTPYQTINDYKNKLYGFDISKRESLFQYTAKNQPIFKQKKMLRSYQLESLNWLINSWYSGRNVILADEMGLGKTIQSIAFLNYLYSFQNMKGPFLVVAPLTTLQHWKRTVEEWSTMNCVLYYDVNGHEGRAACRQYEWYTIDVSIKGAIIKNNELCKFNILITSFEVFLNDYKDILISLPFQHIIIDEAHRLKNQNAKILSALKSLPCERILLLTGTPIQNNTAELWTLLNFIQPIQFFSEEKFLEEYGDLSKAEQIEKLHQTLRPYLLRRMKEDVEKSIPPLQETIIDVEMTNMQKTIYKALYENNKGMLMKGSGFSFNTSLNNLEMQLRKCCNHPFLMKEIEQDLTRECQTQKEYIDKLVSCSGKMILLDKLLEKILKEDGKVLIFSQFTNMLVLIEKYLKARSIVFEKIDGSVKAKERQNSIDRFNTPGSKNNVFLLSTKAGGVGINLTSANVVIIFDSDWNPQNDVQATARAHRIGQENEVKVYRLITKKTYEAEMFERASKKLGLDQAIFLGGAFHSTSKQKGEDDNLKKLSKTEIEILLKRGVIGLLDADNQETDIIQDIDEILKNSRVAKYSLINGTYTFSKRSFTAAETDRDLQMDDPNFWSLVFKNRESDCEKLRKKFNALEASRAFGSADEQRKIMSDLSNLFNRLVEAKIKVDGYSVDDENILNEILTKITSHNSFHVECKHLAFQMITEIQKPSRRCKNIDINKLDLALNNSINSKRIKTVAAKKREIAIDEEKLEEDGNIFQEGSDDEANIFETKNDKNGRDRTAKRKLQPNSTTSQQIIPEVIGKEESKAPENPLEGEQKQKKKKKPTEIVNEAQPLGSNPKANGKSRSVNPERKLPKDKHPLEDVSKAAKPASKESKLSKEEKPKKKALSNGLGHKPVFDGEENGSGPKPSLAKRLPAKELPKFTYADLNLDPPSSVDFSTYKKCWCRYCGARFSAKFCNGPWGHECLCFTHSEMFRKRQLKLNKKEYPELSAPIDIDKNTELEFFSELGSKEKIADLLHSKTRNLELSHRQK